MRFPCPRYGPSASASAAVDPNSPPPTMSTVAGGAGQAMAGGSRGRAEAVSRRTSQANELRRGSASGGFDEESDEAVVAHKELAVVCAAGASTCSNARSRKPCRWQGREAQVRTSVERRRDSPPPLTRCSSEMAQQLGPPPVPPRPIPPPPIPPRPGAAPPALAPPPGPPTFPPVVRGRLLADGSEAKSGVLCKGVKWQASGILEEGSK